MTKRDFNLDAVVSPIGSKTKLPVSVIVRWALLFTILVLPLMSFLTEAHGQSFFAKNSKNSHARPSWLVPKEFGSKAETIAVVFDVDPEWHIYWKNPGDSGAAPKFFPKSDQAEFGSVQWPVPARIPYGDLVNIGYDGKVGFLFEVKPKEGAKKIQAEARVEWLVCKEECIPGFDTIRFEAPVGSGSQWTEADKALVEGFKTKVPKAASESPWKMVHAHLKADRLLVAVEGASREAPEIYPVDKDFLAPVKPSVSQADGRFNFQFQVPGGRPAQSKASFVVADAKGAWEFTDFKVEAAPIETSAVDESIWILILSAFIGGVILNLMPCVFPVLSIKLFSLMKTEQTKKARLREGLLYTAGVLVTFVALGGLFLVLRGAGSAVGWGFQLQSPVVVLAMVFLFWFMALNFLGVFEFGTGVMNIAGKHSHGSSSFGTGVLSVFVAAPCTGPFMGSALGASASLPAVQSMAIFVSLGAGLAAPFLLLAASPKAASLLPRPGRWMETLKQFLAFPLFATVLWLLWVLGIQTGAEGWFVGGSALLLFAFALWLGRSQSKKVVLVAWAIGIAASGFALARIADVQGEATTIKSSSWAAFDAKEISLKRESKQAVFIDFTAAWCITCQLNKKAVLDTSAGQELFKANNVFLVRADWTKQDAAITQALAEFGRNSVPLYVYYPADGSEPKILPQILTLDMISDLFKTTKGGS